MSEDEQPLIWAIYYKIEYPFQAIDATISFALPSIENELGVKTIYTQITSGSVEYQVVYPTFRIYLTLRALDTRLCMLIVTTPQRREIEAQFRSALDFIVNRIIKQHEELIDEVEQAEILIHTNRSRGGRVTWPEDTEAIARLQAGEDREVVKQDWKKRATRRGKRKLTDPDNRFRQLVRKANQG